MSMVMKDRVEERVRAVQRMVECYAQRSLRAARHMSRSLVPGEFRSPYRFPEGIERDVPRLFQPDDDVQYLDTRHISPTLATRSLAEAILRDELRLIQAIRFTESEFVILVDVSRSMLAGLLSDDGGTGQRRTSRKLEALYRVVVACTQVAEVSGFAVRTILVGGDRPEQSRVRTPRHLSQRLVVQITDRLLQSYRQAEADPRHQERFLLGAGLQLALSARRRSALAVVSDFLDPIDGYGRCLAQAVTLHQTILFDLCAAWERRFPEPTWRDWAARHLPVREGARHLEQGTEPMAVDKHVVRQWNAEQQRNRALLQQITSRRQVPVIACLGQGLDQLCFIAWQQLDRVR